MATLGHIAVGVAAGRWRNRAAPWRAMVALSTLSMLPDADVVAFALGIPYAHPFGHRGATHSLAFAVLCGVVAWLICRESRWRDAALVALTVATHPLLDALTDGGLGVALFFPFSNARVFSPWQPLPVAPIGAGMASARGLDVLITEAALFLPCWLYAFWPRRARS